MEKYKLAIIAPTPFYYHIPIYQNLENNQAIDLTVYYCSDEAMRGVIVKKMYMTRGRFVAKESLLKGYKYIFLKNYSLSPSILNWPFGLVNFGIVSEIMKKKYNLIVLQAWTNLTWFLAFFACLISKTPVAFMTDSNIAAEKPKSTMKIFFRKLILKYFLFKFAKGFLASGTANKEFYKFYGVSDKKIILFPFSWGYEKLLSKSSELMKKRDLLRNQYHIKNSDFVILYVGRFSQEKSLETMLDAYNSLTLKNKKMFLVGDGPQRKEIEEKVNNLHLEDVYFLGFKSRDEVLEFYTLADVLILPSLQETWGIVINEAMCFGLPIISSDKVGAAVDLIKEGQNGFIFKVGDSDELAKKIEELDNGKRDVFGRKSKEIIKEWIKINPVDQLLKILENS